MSLSCGFFNSENGDRQYYNEDLSNFFEGLMEDGVFASLGNHLTVGPTTPAGMAVNVGTGRAWFNKTWTKIDAPYTVELTNSDPVLNRIDAICLTINHSRAVRDNYIEVISGTGTTGTPTKPTVENETDIYRHVLAYVTVGKGVTSITQANIEDNVGKTGCPFSKPVWQNIPTTDEMVAQWQAQFDQFMDHIHNTFDYDAAGNLQTQIDTLNVHTACLDRITLKPDSNDEYIGAARFYSVNPGNNFKAGIGTTLFLLIDYHIEFFQLLHMTSIMINDKTYNIDVSDVARDYEDFATSEHDTCRSLGLRMLMLRAQKDNNDIKFSSEDHEWLSDTFAAPLRRSFQAGVDTIYNAITAEGVTPSSSTPTDCAAGIHELANTTWDQLLHLNGMYHRGTVGSPTGSWLQYSCLIPCCDMVSIKIPDGTLPTYYPTIEFYKGDPLTEPNLEPVYVPSGETVILVPDGVDYVWIYRTTSGGASEPTEGNTLYGRRVTLEITYKSKKMR